MLACTSVPNQKGIAWKTSYPCAQQGTALRPCTVPQLVHEMLEGQQLCGLTLQKWSLSLLSFLYCFLCQDFSLSAGRAELVLTIWALHRWKRVLQLRWDMQRANNSAHGNDPVSVSVWAWRPIQDTCTVARPLQAQLLFLCHCLVSGAEGKKCRKWYWGIFP